MKGVEPPRRRRQILSLVRLPIPPHPHFTLYIVGGGWWIRTTESDANRFTVCPLWPLGKSSMFGAGNRTRTYNLLITSQLLYQLSHTSILFKKYFGDLEGARTLDLQRDRLAF